MCFYPNDELFNFCQSCGYKRKRIDELPTSSKKLRFPVEERAIDLCLTSLRNAREDTPYHNQKSALETELSSFLLQLSTLRTIISCCPLDIVKFLVWKDNAGKTKVHESLCSAVGGYGPANCTSPTRLGFGTVDSTIGKLRAIFTFHKRN